MKILRQTVAALSPCSSTENILRLRVWLSVEHLLEMYEATGSIPRHVLGRPVGTHFYDDVEMLWPDPAFERANVMLSLWEKIKGSCMWERKQKSKISM